MDELITVADQQATEAGHTLGSAEYNTAILRSLTGQLDRNREAARWRLTNVVLPETERELTAAERRLRDHMAVVFSAEPDSGRTSALEREYKRVTEIESLRLTDPDAYESHRTAYLRQLARRLYPETDRVTPQQLAQARRLYDEMARNPAAFQVLTQLRIVMLLQKHDPALVSDYTRAAAAGDEAAVARLLGSIDDASVREQLASLHQTQQRTARLIAHAETSATIERVVATVSQRTPLTPAQASAAGAVLRTAPDAVLRQISTSMETEDQVIRARIRLSSQPLLINLASVPPQIRLGTVPLQSLEARELAYGAVIDGLHDWPYFEAAGEVERRAIYSVSPFQPDDEEPPVRRDVKLSRELFERLHFDQSNEHVQATLRLLQIQDESGDLNVEQLATVRRAILRIAGRQGRQLDQVTVESLRRLAA